MKRWNMKAGLRLLVAAALVAAAIGCGGTENDNGGGDETGGSAGTAAGGSGGTVGEGGSGGEAGQGGSAGTGAGGTGGTTGTGGTGGSAATDPLCNEDPTWDAFAQPLMERECLECHSVNVTGAARQRAPVGVNFDTEADLRARKTTVLREVRGGAMPPNDRLDACVVAKLQEFFAQ